MSVEPRVVIFGSCLVSRTPRDIDFSFQGCTLNEAYTAVNKWRADNVDRWDVVPNYLHATEGLIEGDSILIAMRDGQTEAKTETVMGKTAVPRVVSRECFFQRDEYYRRCPTTDRYGQPWITGMPW